MALKTALSTRFGLDLAEAYFKIVAFNGDEKNVTYSVHIYADEKAYLDGKPPVEKMQCTCPYVAGMDVIEDGYACLMMHDKAKNAAVVADKPMNVME